MANFNSQYITSADSGLKQFTNFWQSEFKLGWVSTTSNESVVRIGNIQIPPNSIIDSAVLSIVVNSQSSGTFTARNRIYCQDILDAVQITNYATYLALTRTTAYTDKNFIAPLTIGGIQTIDVTNQLQELINKTGWQSGNDVLFIFDDTGSDQGNYQLIFETAYNSGTSPNYYPRLDGTYTPPAAEGSFTENIIVLDLISRLRLFTTQTFTENLNVSDNTTPLATYIKGFIDSVSVSDFKDGFNFSQWFKTYARLAVPVYYFRLNDIEIPISSFTCRSTDGQPTFLSVSIPDADKWVDIITANQDADLYIDMAFKVGGLVSLRENLIWTHFNTLSISNGGSSRSIVLAGYRTITDVQQTIIASASPITRNVSNDGKLRFTFAIPDLYAKTGDLYIVGDESFKINSISYTISTDQITMSISE